MDSLNGRNFYRSSNPTSLAMSNLQLDQDAQSSLALIMLLFPKRLRDNVPKALKVYDI